MSDATTSKGTAIDDLLDSTDKKRKSSRKPHWLRVANVNDDGKQSAI
jgi:hypothetical protein